MESIINEDSQDSQISLSHNETLRSAWQLLKDAGGLYSSKFLTSIGIMIIPVVVTIILNELKTVSISSSFFSQAVWLSAIKVIIWLLSLYVNAISISALLFVVKNNIGAKEAIGLAFRSGFSYILLIILRLLVITGGFIVFIIPGIIFLVWFNLAMCSFVFEDKRGIEALYRSKELIAGKFWKVAWRIFFIYALVVIVITAISIIAGKLLGSTHGIIDNILLLFTTPLVIFFEAIMFKDLVELKESSSIQQAKNSSRFLYGFLAIIAAPILIGLVIFQGLILFATDMANPDDSDLRLSEINIPSEQNAFYSLMEAGDNIYWPQDEIDDNGNDSALIAEILQKNEANLNSFEKGIALPIFQQPELQNLEGYNADSVLKSTGSLRDLAKVNSLKAQRLFNQGKEKESFDQLMKTIKLAQLIQDGQNGLIGYLVGSSIKEIGLNGIRELLNNSHHLASAALLDYKDELNKYKENRAALQKNLKVEYMSSINSKEQLVDPFIHDGSYTKSGLLDNLSKDQVWTMQSAGGNFYYQPNRTKLEFMSAYRNMIENAGKANYAEIKLSSDEIPSLARVALTSNGVGKLISKMINISLNSVYERELTEDVSVNEVQLLLAMKAYKQDTGNLPNSLEDLVPNYIYEIMPDPFDGKSMKYSSSKKIIYSTGKDLVDNDGNIFEDDWRHGDDLGFEIKL